MHVIQKLIPLELIAESKLETHLIVVEFLHGEEHKPY